MNTKKKKLNITLRRVTFYLTYIYFIFCISYTPYSHTITHFQYRRLFFSSFFHSHTSIDVHFPIQNVCLCMVKCRTETAHMTVCTQDFALGVVQTPTRLILFISYHFLLLLFLDCDAAHVHVYNKCNTTHTHTHTQKCST